MCEDREAQSNLFSEIVFTDLERWRHDFAGSNHTAFGIPRRILRATIGHRGEAVIY
jgi:hypothetical protein